MKAIAILAATVALASCASAAAPLKCPPPISALTMTDGSYSPQSGVTFELHGFSGHLVPRGHRPPLCYLKYTQLDHGHIFVTSESLSNIFTQRLADANSPIQNVTIETGDNTVKITGKIKKAVLLSFELDGPITTDGTNLTLQTNKIKADGIPVKGLLELFGKQLSSFAGAQGSNGVSVQGDALTFQPAQLAQLRGHIDSVAATPAGLTLHYGPTHHSQSANPAKPSN